MVKFIKVLLTTALLTTFGCALERKPLYTTFNHNQITWSQIQGEGSVSGSALIRQNGGGVVTCAGTDIYLVPSSSYAKERMMRIYGNNSEGYVGANFNRYNAVVPPPGPGYIETSKKTICDAQGFFQFIELAAGSYFIISEIIWSVGNSNQGGYLMKSVEVRDSPIEVVLAP